MRKAVLEQRKSEQFSFFSFPNFHVSVFVGENCTVNSQSRCFASTPRIRKFKSHQKKKMLFATCRRKRQTLSDMIGGDDYMDYIDAGVAASEQSVTMSVNEK